MITIIVLLILATVSISLVINNGVLDKAQHGVDRYSEEEELEQIKLAVAAAMLKGNGFLTKENLENELEKINETGRIKDETEKGWNYSGSTDKKYYIYKTGEVKEQTRLLPIQYQQVEYIKSNGSQFIITNDCVDTIDKVISEISFSEVKDSFVCGNPNHIGNSNGYSYIFISLSSSFKFQYKYNQGSTWKSSNNMPIKNQRYLFESYLTSGIQYLKVNNNIEVSSTDDDILSTDEKFQIFKSDTSWSANIYLYSMILKKEEEIKRNFIPCYSTTNVTNAEGVQVPANTKGLYDLVEGKFYTNKNTSGEDFIAGPDV